MPMGNSSMRMVVLSTLFWRDKVENIDFEGDL